MSKFSKSYYETLNVTSSASKKEIRDAYIKKSKVLGTDDFISGFFYASVFRSVNDLIWKTTRGVMDWYALMI